MNAISFDLRELVHLQTHLNSQLVDGVLTINQLRWFADLDSVERQMLAEMQYKALYKTDRIRFEVEGTLLSVVEWKKKVGLKVFVESSWDVLANERIPVYDNYHRLNKGASYNAMIVRMAEVGRDPISFERIRGFIQSKLGEGVQLRTKAELAFLALLKLQGEAFPKNIRTIVVFHEPFKFCGQNWLLTLRKDPGKDLFHIGSTTMACGLEPQDAILVLE